MYLLHRLSRYRKNKAMRDLFSEAGIAVEKLVQPYFVVETAADAGDIDSMPGIARISIDELVKEVGQHIRVGIRNVLLFGIPSAKTDDGSQALKADGVVQRAIYALRKEFGADIIISADVCVCSYLNSGHCGIIRRRAEGLNKDNIVLDNEATLSLLGKIAGSYARAGADIVAPSAMADGQVKAIRTALDLAKFESTLIMSYSSKFASALYGPFRDAMESAPGFGDRSSYQLDFRGGRQALRESLLDEEEGADVLMVKPALFYLDILSRLRQLSALPIAVYNVSGEYSMIKYAAEKGAVDEKKVVMEMLTSYFRAGADIVITYYANEVAQWLK